MTDLRVAVIGVGAMGWNHARIYAALKGVDLVGVVDADCDRAARAAAEFDCPVLPSLEAASDVADAVSVAVPSTLHAEVAGPLLERGVHCLVEKPLAPTIQEAKELVAAAAASGAVLLVGHVERFNPAVQQLQTILEDGHEIAAVDVRRMSTVSSRIVDVDVVADLMVHDIDIVLELLGEDIVDIAARAVQVGDAQGDDYVTALLSFASGAVASLTASRITQNKIRTLQVTTDSSYFTVDYANQELIIYREGAAAAWRQPDLDHGQYALELRADRVFVRSEEPLLRELRHFVQAARGKEAPAVTGQRAITVLELVDRVRENARIRRTGG